MLWEELLLDRRVPDRILARALADALGIPETSMRVVEDVADAPATADGATLLLVDRTGLTGDFPLQLSLYVRDADLARRIEPPAARLASVVRLCQLLDCTALLPDDSLNPFSWLRVRPSGAVDAVTLDPDRLDRDEFVVVSARPADLPAAQVP